MSTLVSIVIPCRNEEQHVEQALRDALAQQRDGFEVEVLVAVGPSKDRTAEIVHRMAAQHPAIRFIDNPAGVVPHGLNAAIRAARGTYIVRMDAHSRYPADYVAVLVPALDRLKADNVGGIWETLPANDGNEAWAIAQVLSSKLGVGNAHFRLGTEDERPVDTVPYGCFRRELFDRIGWFDEELVRNQDDEHNGRIIRAGGRIMLLPQVRIQYFSRDRISKLWRMYREYGLFKPLVNLKLGAPATLRQFAPPLFVLALIGGPVLALFVHWMIWPWIALVVLYFGVLKSVSLRIALKAHRPGAYLWLLLAFLTVHLSYGIGYWQGLWRFTLLRRRVRPNEIATNR
ncbi:MAG TPA: glycosyltransferase family 2 protein [Flavobacteriales bacterium]